MKVKSWLITMFLSIFFNSAANAIGFSGFILPGRYYDSGNGRFVSPDTIVPNLADPQSFNRYAYVRNNPINLIDPSGHSWLSDATGVHWNANRVIHHNLGINSIRFGVYAGVGGEMSFYFSDNDVKVGGGVGAGVGFQFGTSFNDFDVQTSQGAYVSAGYDPYGGTYVSAGGGIGPVNGSGVYYPKSNDYQVGGGVSTGRTGFGASYASTGGIQLSAGGYGYGATYALNGGKTRFSVNPVAFGGYMESDKTTVQESWDGKPAGGPGKIGNLLVPDFWWGESFYRHDKRFSNGKGIGELHYANQAMSTDMIDRSVDLMRNHPILIPVVMPVTALMVPLYYTAVSVPGAVYYWIINAN